MPKFQIYFAPEGKLVDVRWADTSLAARRAFVREFPKYKRAQGELYTVEVIASAYYNALYCVRWLGTGDIEVRGIVDNRRVETWSHGAWEEDGRLPDRIRAIAIRNRALMGAWL